MATQDTYTPWVTERTNYVTNPGMETTGAATTMRTNVASNPVPVGITGWNAAVAPIVTAMSDGTPCLETTSNGAATPYIWSSKSTVALASGDTYVLSAMMEVVGDVAGSSYTIRAHGTTGNVYFASGSTAFPGDTVGPQRVTIICTVSAAVAAGEFDFTAVRQGAGAAGVKLRMGKVQIEKAKVPGVPVQFDGSTAANQDHTFIWSGTANASTSLCQSAVVTNGSGTGAVAGKATSSKHSGSNSLKVITAGLATAEGGIISNITPPAMPGKTYSGGIWVNAPVGAQLYMVVRTSGAVSQDTPQTLIVGTGDWQFVKAEGKLAQSDATNSQIHVRTRTSAQPITFFLDDAVLEEAATLPDTGFNGDTTDPYPRRQYIWSGVANASTSLYQDRSVDVPGDHIPVLNLATKDILYGDRVTSYRWEVLKHSTATGLDTLVGTLDGVSDGQLTFTQNASVKGGGKIQVADLAVAQPGMLRVADVALESVRLRPVCAIQGLPENPLGVFLVSAGVEQWDTTGRVWGLELLDRCTVPAQDAVDSSYAVAAGTLILNQVKTILASSNEYLAVDTSNTLATQSNMVWEAGTSKLKIINDLLDVANYNALWVDGYGNFQTTPRVLPANRSINYELLGFPKELIDGELSIYRPDWTRDRDSYDVPNKVIAIQSAGGNDAPALVGTYTNTDPTSPYSTVTRGRTIPHVLDSVDCPAGTDPQTIAFLQSRAQTTLIQMSATQATVKVTNLPIPVRVSDVIRFANVPAGVDDRHVITRIQLDTTSLGLMQLTLQEVISL
jgi:hypothetical protein